MKKIFEGKIFWIDIVSPDKEDLDYLKNNFHLHPLIIEELKNTSSRTKAEVYDDYVFLVLHLPSWNLEEKNSYPWEIDFILKKDAIITVCYEENAEIKQELMEKIYNKEFESLYLNDSVKLFHFIIENFLNFALRQISHIQEKIDAVEKEIFRGKQEKIIPDIAFIKRDIINFRKIFQYLKENLLSLERKSSSIFGEDKKIYFDDLVGESSKVENLINGFQDTINALESTNNSLIEHKNNVLTKIYTVISFVTWPALLIVSMYQMNTRFLPLTGLPYDFFIVIGLAFTPSVIFYLYMKAKKII